jgi:hypothetical protein
MKSCIGNTIHSNLGTELWQGWCYMFKSKAFSTISGRGLRMLVLLLVAIWLMLALISFSPHDQGWLYEDTDTRAAYSNHAGKYGAWYASLLIALIGGAAPWFIVLIVLMSLPIAAQRDRYSGAALGLISMSMLAAYQGEDSVGVPPGGIFGQLACSYLLYYVDSSVVYVLIIAMLWSSLVLLFGAYYPWRISNIYKKLLIKRYSMVQKSMVQKTETAAQQATCTITDYIASPDTMRGPTCSSTLDDYIEDIVRPSMERREWFYDP